MSTWEPFSAPARHAFVRAQAVAQMFGSSSIGPEHVAFALAEADDDVGRAFANALDRDAIRARLGVASAPPAEEMTFSRETKRVIEAAFENARALNHALVGNGHIALGILDAEDPPKLAAGTEQIVLRAELQRLAEVETG